MDHWVEAADWIVWQLCGEYVRNACTAGYKGIWQDGAYPTSDFEEALNPEFAGFAKSKLDHRIGALGDRAGGLTAQAARWTGLPEGIAVAVGNVDAHVTAPAARAVEAGQMLAIMGTSTCHVMNHDQLVEVPGMCGVVDGGILAGSFGYEAGQSGVGDIFAWYVDNQVPGRYFEAAEAAGESIHEHLTDARLRRTTGCPRPGRARLGERKPVGARRRVAVGVRPRSDAEHASRTGLPGAARGDGVRFPHDRRDLRGGGRAGPRVRRGRRAAEEPPPDAAVRRRAAPADLHDRLRAGSGAGFGDPRRRRRRRLPGRRAASDAMGRVERAVYTPDPRAADVYDRLYAEYRLLHDHFGRGANDVMKRLKQMRPEAIA